MNDYNDPDHTGDTFAPNPPPPAAPTSPWTPASGIRVADVWAAGVEQTPPDPGAAPMLLTDPRPDYDAAAAYGQTPAYDSDAPSPWQSYDLPPSPGAESEDVNAYDEEASEPRGGLFSRRRAGGRRRRQEEHVEAQAVTLPPASTWQPEPEQDPEDEAAPRIRGGLFARRRHPEPEDLGQVADPQTSYAAVAVWDDPSEEDEEGPRRRLFTRRGRRTDEDAGSIATHRVEEPWALPSHEAARPSALLLSPIDRERADADRLRRSAAGGLSLLVVVLVVGALWAHSTESKAASDLASAQASLTSMGQTVDSAQSTDLAQTLSQREQQISTLLAGAVDDRGLIDSVAGAMPAGVTLTGYSTDQTAPCPTPDPFQSPAAPSSSARAGVKGLGCLTITGTAPGPGAVSGYVHNLGDRSGQNVLLSPFLSSTSQDTGGRTQFTIAVTYTTAARLPAYAPIIGNPAPTAPAAAGTTNGEQ